MKNIGVEKLYEGLSSKTNNKIPYKTFSKVIKEFFYQVAVEVLNGKTFTFPLGSIKIVRVPRNFTKPTIDWPSSLKLRDRIREEGGTPYSKEHAPHGKKWFVYYTDPYCRWNWIQKKFIRNIKRYSFQPTFSNKRALRDKIRSTDIPELIFDMTDIKR